jgi:hypothetical protein
MYFKPFLCYVPALIAVQYMCCVEALAFQSITQHVLQQNPPQFVWPEGVVDFFGVASKDDSRPNNITHIALEFLEGKPLKAYIKSDSGTNNCFVSHSTSQSL